MTVKLLSSNVGSFKAHFKSCKSKELRGHRSKVHSVAWSPISGTFLASGSTDHTIRLYPTDSILQAGEVLGSSDKDTMELKGHKESVDQLAWSPLQEHVLASASADKTVKLWDCRMTKECVASISTTGENINVCWSPDGHRILVGSKDDLLSVIDVSKQSIEASQKFTNEVNEIAWTTDGIYMTSGTGQINLYRYADMGDDDVFALRTSFSGHAANCYCLDVRDNWMAVGAADSLVSLWRRTSRGDDDGVGALEGDPMWVCVRTLGSLEWPVRTISQSHDSCFVSAGSEDSHLDIWHTETGELLTQVPVKAALNTMDWHPRRYLLAWGADEVDRSGKAEGNVRVFGFTP